MGALSRLGLLLELSLRSLFSHKVKSAIVGTIILFGTFLVVLGTSVVDAIEGAMARSITASLAGHLQVYSAKGKDELALFGGAFMGAEDVGRIDDFAAVPRALAGVGNVKAIVPMGLDMATVVAPGELEGTLASLRAALRDGRPELLPGLAAQAREIIGQLVAEKETAKAIASAEEKARLDEALALLGRGASDALWATFDAAPLDVLEFLDTRVAPLAEEGKLLYFRYVGTDLDRFREHFDRLEIVKGQDVPPGHRGFLINERTHEKWVKNFVARTLDHLHQKTSRRGVTIAGDPALQSMVRQMVRQAARVTHQLDAREAAQVTAELRRLFPDEAGGLDALVRRFLAVDDATVAARHALFYSVIAPHLDLYAVDVGDVITLQAFTRSGFMKSVDVKVYGTFRFEGLEDSDLAGSHSLLDLVTFRELYGLMTDERRAELDELRREAGLARVDRDDAEAALFGGGGATTATVAEAGGFDEFAGAGVSRGGEAGVPPVFDHAEVERGLALNAAIVLEDPSRLEETRREVEAALRAAGLEVKVVGWQTAAGMVGQVILVIQGVLYVAIAIIFLVALVIINNSMVMATVDRTPEIGTMRAIGAPRALVLSMFLLETLALGAVAGGLGIALGAAVVQHLGAAGIPAPADELIFVFGGPRLYPAVGAGNLGFALAVILGVSVISTLYPAYLAARIQPIEAMRTKE